MAKTKKVKTGNVDIPADDFNEENLTAHISIRLPLSLLKELRRLALTEEYSGRYQVLIKDILTDFTLDAKKKKRSSAKAV